MGKKIFLHFKKTYKKNYKPTALSESGLYIFLSSSDLSILSRETVEHWMDFFFKILSTHLLKWSPSFIAKISYFFQYLLNYHISFSN